ncbi:MAG: hypothetical protein AABX07_03860, partial [Nanoarchaeota archaeon]
SCAEFSGSKTECEEQGSNAVTKKIGGIILEPLAAPLLHPCGDSYIIASCKYQTECSCSWKADAEKKCQFTTTRKSANPACVSGSCSYTAENLGLCESGYQRAKITATPAPSDFQDVDCVSKETNIPCGRSLLALPFFGLLQFFLALLLIVFIYFAFRKKFFGRRELNAKKEILGRKRNR